LLSLCVQNAISLRLLDVNHAGLQLQNLSAQSAVLSVQTKMANVVVTLKIMPESPEVDLNQIKESSLKHIKEFAGAGDTKITEEPVAFGLKSLNILFIMDEKLGSPESLEEDIRSIKGVQSVEIIDVRRAIG